MAKNGGIPQTDKQKKWFAVQIGIAALTILGITIWESLTCWQPFFKECSTLTTTNWPRYLGFFLLLLSGPISGYFNAVRYGGSPFAIGLVIVMMCLSYGPIIIYCKYKKMGVLLLPIGVFFWIYSGVFFNVAIYM